MGDFSPIPGSRAGGFVRFLSAVGNTTGVANFATGGRSVNYSGGGIVSVGFSSSTLIISASSATSQGLSAIGNTTALTSAQSNALTAMTISATGGVSVGYSNSTMVISGAVSATSQGLFAAGANTTGLTSSQTNALTALTVSGAGGVSVGYSNNTMVISGPLASAASQGLSVVAQSTALTSSQSNAITALSMSGAGGVSIGFSNSTMIISGALSIPTINWFEPVPLNTALSATFSLSSSTGGSRYNHHFGFQVPQPVNFGQIRLIGSFIFSGLSLATTTKSTTTSGSAGCTLTVALYSQVTTGGLLNTMSSSTQNTVFYQVSGSLSASSSVYSQSLSFTWGSAGIGSTSTTLSQAFTTTGGSYNAFPTGLSSFTALPNYRPIDFNMAGVQQTMQPGNVAVALAASHVTAVMSFSPQLVGVFNTIVVSGMGTFNTNSVFFPNLGSTLSTTNLVSYNWLNLTSSMASNFRPYVLFLL